MPVEQPGLRRREQRLSGRDRTGVAGSDGAEGVEIERVADVLKPPEPERRERHGLDAPQVLHQRRAANLDLYPVIAQVPEASDFIAEVAQVVRGIVVSAPG